MSDLDLIKTLNQLISVSKDGEKGFAASAAQVSDPKLAILLRARAQECLDAAHDLQELVRILGGEPQLDGSLAGALQRGRESAQASLALDRDHAILAECEKGEEHAKAVYSAALKEKLPPDVHGLVAAQYHGVVKNRNSVKSLRDQLAPLKPPVPAVEARRHRP